MAFAHLLARLVLIANTVLVASERGEEEDGIDKARLDDKVMCVHKVIQVVLVKDQDDIASVQLPDRAGLRTRFTLCRGQADTGFPVPARGKGSMHRVLGPEP